MLLKTSGRWAAEFRRAAVRPAATACKLKPAACARQAAVERWAMGLLGGIDHERRIRRTATRLFQLARPLHALGPADLRLLRLAAIVHDVGRCVDDDTHPQEGARLILAAGHLPLTSADRRALAYLTLYHKGKVPDAGEEAILRPGDDAPRLRVVLALLRAADALDGRSLQSPRLLFALTGSGHLRDAARGDVRPTLWIRCLLDGDCEKARRTYARKKKFLLLEETLGCAVDLSVVHLDAMEMAA